MDCIPVQCMGNNSKQYNGNVWLKRLQDIAKVNSKKLSSSLFPSKRSRQTDPLVLVHLSSAATGEGTNWPGLQKCVLVKITSGAHDKI